ncbi:MAG: hypothetical protein IH969_07895, partial [Candidatus Krumholzibacteriota bacterium]|nr:hypothetical protein [Candidatus Krumholzibacteriota bacterium]
MYVKIRCGKFVRVATLAALAVVAVSASAGAQEKSPWQAIGGLYGGYHTVEATNQAGDFTYNVDTRSGDLELIFGLFLDAWANRWGGVIEAGRVSEDYDDLLFSDELLTVNGTLEQQLFSLEGFAYFTLWGAEKDRPLDVLVGARSFFLRSKIAIFSNQTQFG